MEQLVKNLERERDQVRKSNNNNLPYKTYTDSTLRYGRQQALASDIDTMSGATTGNILNAVELDEKNKDVPNVVIVAGKNALNANMETKEFL